jgi:hypothetical protein
VGVLIAHFNNSPEARNVTGFLAGIGVAITGIILLLWAVIATNDADSYYYNPDKSEVVRFILFYLSLIATAWGIIIILHGYGMFTDVRNMGVARKDAARIAARNSTLITAGFIVTILGAITALCTISCATLEDTEGPYD